MGKEGHTFSDGHTDAEVKVFVSSVLNITASYLKQGILKWLYCLEHTMRKNKAAASCAVELKYPLDWYLKDILGTNSKQTSHDFQLINLLIQILTAILNAHKASCSFERYQVYFEKKTQAHSSSKLGRVYNGAKKHLKESQCAQMSVHCSFCSVEELGLSQATNSMLMALDWGSTGQILHCLL